MNSKQMFKSSDIDKVAKVIKYKGIIRATVIQKLQYFVLMETKLLRNIFCLVQLEKHSNIIQHKEQLGWDILGE